jgi:hypothetical protein
MRDRREAHPCAQTTSRGHPFLTRRKKARPGGSGPEEEYARQHRSQRPNQKAVKVVTGFHLVNAGSADRAGPEKAGDVAPQTIRGECR